MTLVFYIIIGVITFGAFLHAWVKKEYNISRTIIINKPRAEVFAFVRQLKNQPRWIPWYHRDPNIQLKYKGDDGKVEAAAYWKGNNNVGEGIQRITKVKEGKVFESQLLFLKPYKTFSQLYIGVKELDGERTKMVLGVRGIHRFPASLLGMLYRLDKTVGNDLEMALHKLKGTLEGS